MWIVRISQNWEILPKLFFSLTFLFAFVFLFSFLNIEIHGAWRFLAQCVFTRVRVLETEENFRRNSPWSWASLEKFNCQRTHVSQPWQYNDHQGNKSLHTLCIFTGIKMMARLSASVQGTALTFSRSDEPWREYLPSNFCRSFLPPSLSLSFHLFLSFSFACTSTYISWSSRND